MKTADLQAVVTADEADDFSTRHIGPDQEQIDAMLESLGVASLDDLIGQVIPADIRSARPLELPPALSERQALARLREMGTRNRHMVSMIGAGYHDTILPSVIQRNVLEDPGWYTAYTPYQAEISQGRLEALMNFQQMVMDLTGMEIANASLLDEATAVAEAMSMSLRVTKKSGGCFFVDERAHPQTLAVLRTRAWSMGIELRVGDIETDFDPDAAFGMVIQYPATDGGLRDPRAVIARARAADVLVTVATDLLALTLLTPPGEMDADIAVGSSQRFGVPMGFGGPHAAFFATRDAFRRQMPGRLIGLSVDSAGNPAYRMALQTREQHIRRDKATSNICTAQVLLAVIAGCYAVYHGPEGLKRIARRVHRKAAQLADGLRRLGFQPEFDTFFDTVTVKVPGAAAAIANRAAAAGVNLRVIDAGRIGIACDQTTGADNLETVWRAFSEGDGHGRGRLQAAEVAVPDTVIPAALRRSSGFMSHPVFHLYRNETEMMRYLRRLRDKDITLNRSMIPLGSCTMKLNAATEMVPVSWPEFADIHPHAPETQTLGYQQLCRELESALCAVTGYDAVSLQPNAGSQGEYAGLLAIRKYHEARGEGQRNICLIPDSAHGTNPASAVMAGMKVVVVGGDARGDVDVADLRAKAEKHAGELAALMITYPSTHGVFEGSIREICEIIHQHGGQVYMDGANMNAMMGLVQPGKIGADVSHLNLHKTFCIPHGGGGPGVGPIGVKAHLAPYLPVSPLEPGAVGAVSAAPWGSAGILPISWAYTAMTGGPGLTQCSKVAILSANYVATRLSPHYPVLYTGASGRVAHECVIDIRPIKAACGVTAEDIAKRLMDYGFHAPTMSFPVAETLMIEPTESESKSEIDRFCDAMIRIRGEIAEIESGAADRAVNPLKKAPHTASLLLADSWDLPYSRQQAFFPGGGKTDSKYWPPTGRIDNVYGDRNLVCSCPPVEAYLDSQDSAG